MASYGSSVILRLIILLPLGAADFLNEFVQQARIFLSWFRLNATCDVDSVGAHDANRRGHVFDL